MISLQDCIGLCGLSEEDVHAIAEHDNVPDVVAAAYASYLSHTPHGLETVRDMIVDDIRAAQAKGDTAHTTSLLHTLHHFLRAHPEVPVRLS